MCPVFAFIILHNTITMNKQFTIQPCQKENITAIINGINTYNESKVPALATAWTPLEFVIKDENCNEIGGVLGGIGCWNGLEINILWVAETYRGTGIGTHLLNHIENTATSMGAEIAMLDTFDFQAEGFYLKNGYTVTGTIDNFPKGHKRIYLSKPLKP